MDWGTVTRSFGVVIPEGNFMVVTECNQHVQGFLVDRVNRIVNVNWGDILPPPKGIGNNNYLTTVTRGDGVLVGIIDTEKVWKRRKPVAARYRLWHGVRCPT
jgi:two-component system chemotaxis response regulator CheV